MTTSGGRTGVYLCQVSEEVACGACCGLYNVSALCRPGLSDMLARRTEAFAGVPRTEDALYDFQKSNERRSPPQKPFPQFYHCPFLGLIGTGRLRVGCLLHPDAPGNAGNDLRQFSWYGEQACRTYFCPTATALGTEYQLIVRGSMNHWFDYGLIVTEFRLLTAFFNTLEHILQRRVVAADFSRNEKAAALFREFATLKSRWPFRREDAPGPCHYLFENGEYARPPVRRCERRMSPSCYEEIFRELESEFQTPALQRRAELYLDGLFSRLAAALQNIRE